MKKIFTILLFTCFVCTETNARQQQASPCRNNPVYRQFDFWIGEWDAFDPKGNKAGESKIELILDSCVILENWKSMGSVNYSGKSFNTFNSQANKWQQTWVDNAGGITYYSNGEFNDGKMIVTTPNDKQPDNSYKMLRMTFSKLSDDKVRQFGESSVDNGNTWKTDFDLEYRRRK